MAKLLFFQIILNLSFALTILLVNAQINQSNFISIDCGALENYTDEITGINYTSDFRYIDTGESNNISVEFSRPQNNISQQYQNVRSFPEGKKNCYKLTPSMGKDNRYLIRASFLYGNYDGADLLPEFDLYLGVNKWKTVKIEDTGKVTSVEIIHFLHSDYIHVCLVRRGDFTPFISALEMRLLDVNSYESESGSLEYFARYDCGPTSGKTVRFGDDVWDRTWNPLGFTAWEVTETKLPVKPNFYEQPSVVMSTAVTPRNRTNSIVFRLNAQDVDEEISEFYLYLHFSEVENLRNNETREFDIYVNSKLWYGPFSPSYLSAMTIYGATGINNGSNVEVLISKTNNSAHPPLLNAFEVYTVKHFRFSETDKKDVDAITNVKSTYNISRDWQGDPCEPRDYKWEGLDCSYNGSDPPRITSLNLSSSGLTGEIDPLIHNLTSLEKLDLSYNNLSGNVPGFLSQMSSLKFLDINGNNFSGTLPQVLIEKSNNGSIVLRADGYSHLCLTSPCNKKDIKDNNKNDKKKIIIIVAVSVGGFLLLVLIAGTIFRCLIRRAKKSNTTMVTLDSVSIHQGDQGIEPKKQQFSYSQVLSITNNFERILGKGGFGTVYHGYLTDESQVAVKMLSRSSAQGFKQFNAEAKILTKVHHKKLTAIIGYCDEGPNMGIVYEYMPNGDLASHLSSKNENPLSWKMRLKIAIDAAKGLEYLHCGIKPPIIHRDVKSTNILLNDKMQAKLSDFGLSRAFSLEDDTHVSTVVVGTPGYVDPLYFTTDKLTEKSDVFSFGVVLLEIITGRPAISNKNSKDHIIKWVDIRLAKNGDVKDILDPRLEQDFNKNSVWKAVEVAMACIDLDSSKRPFVTQVVADLKLCLETDMASSDAIGSTELVEMVSTNPESGLFAR